MKSELVGIAFHRLGQIDQEILRLRHVEQRSNSHVAQSLQVDATTASALYLQAIRRLKAEIDGASSTYQPFAATTVATPTGAMGERYRPEK